ncbi:MAG: protein translocase subunit SecD [Corynebacterium humireducens]|uniref:Protein translocase subunit SecD n=2 Tax=Corynebacterium humireducens TaxID=1223514 RepID=A0A0B5DAY9_9CORY|nr:protein translocase subunit SecD [Corynebacterium humireducens]AJE33328.1 preprotein translocase subunit SecD [Corynebacterium humireducens NBRC 106098 = DSM 45392]NLA56379.1 protein translocase subunit SecD [Corynebacterium humireducens]
MSVTTRREKPGAQRAWPKRALALFALILAVVWALVLFTGDRQASPKLGIDLQGGTRVTLVPQGQEPTADQLAQARTILENRVNGMGVSGASVVTDGNTLVITVPGEDTSQARSVGQTSQLLFRPVEFPANPDNEALTGTLGEMANRWVELGVVTKEEAESSMRLILDAFNQQLPEGTDPVEAPEVTATPLPEPANSIEATERRQQITDQLRADRQSTDPTVQAAATTLLRCDSETDPLAGSDEPHLPLVTCDAGSGQVYLLGPAPLLSGVTDEDGPRLTGNEIDTSRAITGGFNPQSGQMEINFAFKTDGPNSGSQTWAELTQQYLQQQVAITLDSRIISAPVIQSATPFGSGTSITGSFTQEEAAELANNLRYGALPLSFAGEDGEPGGTAQSVPASLGVASLQAGLIAGVVGLILVAIFVFAYYRLFGFISLVTLFTAGLLVYGSLILLGRWIGYSLDLSGVAGLIIGIGTTADSFVVFYERVKDEVREGRTFRSAAQHGWDRAKRTIVTGNMVTLIGAVVIYFLAVGEVKGFAFTLGLTTVFDLVVTFLVTAPLMLLAARKPFFAKPSVNGMGKVFELAAQNRREARDTTAPALVATASTEEK